MVPGPWSFTVSDRAAVQRVGSDPDRVVWVSGKQGISTDGALCRALAHAIALDDAAIVVDLSEAEPIGLSTLAVIVRTREVLRTWSRSMAVRSPSESARRLMDICGVNDLLGPQEAHRVVAKALASWVTVPASEVADRRSGRSAPMAVPIAGGPPGGGAAAGILTTPPSVGTARGPGGER